MTCKLSRKKSKKLYNVIKLRRELLSYYSSNNEDTSRSFMNVLRNNVIYKRKNINFFYDYDSIDFLLDVSPMKFNFDTDIKLNCLCSSIVKRSRIKNINEGIERVISIKQLLDYEPSLNPVLIYFIILYRKETGISYDM